MNAAPLHYLTLDHATAADIDAVDAGISAFNAAQPALAQVQALYVFAKDAHGTVVGGAVGRTWGACCELQQLWVHEAQRKQGVGAHILAQFEQAAAQRGCNLVYLDTFSFQAPQFYAKYGYQVALETRGFTDGMVKTTMHKRLL
jgi:GNAT superfamily N-acetyltransferase